MLEAPRETDALRTSRSQREALGGNVLPASKVKAVERPLPQDVCRAGRTQAGRGAGGQPWLRSPAAKFPLHLPSFLSSCLCVSLLRTDELEGCVWQCRQLLWVMTLRVEALPRQTPRCCGAPLPLWWWLWACAQGGRGQVSGCHLLGHRTRWLPLRAPCPSWKRRTLTHNGIITPSSQKMLIVHF